MKNRLTVLMGNRQYGRSTELRQLICNQVYENKEKNISVLTVSFKQFMYSLMSDFNHDVLGHIMAGDKTMISYENINLENTTPESHIPIIIEKVSEQNTSDIEKILLVVNDEFPYDSNVCIDYIKLLSTFLDMGLNVDIIVSKLNKDNDPANLEWVSSESNISKDSIRYKESKIKKGVVDDNKSNRG